MWSMWDTSSFCSSPAETELHHFLNLTGKCGEISAGPKRQNPGQPRPSSQIKDALNPEDCCRKVLSSGDSLKQRLHEGVIVFHLMSSYIVNNINSRRGQLFFS